MSAKSRRIIPAVAIAAVVLAGMVVVLLRTAEPPTADLKVEFLGMTNGQTATLQVSNPNRRTIEVFPGLPQRRKTDGEWGMVTFPSSGAASTTVEPGKMTRIEVVIPDDRFRRFPCRIPVLWIFKPTRFDFWKAICRQNWLHFRETGKVLGMRVGFGVMGQTNYSDSINLPFGVYDGPLTAGAR